MRKRIRGFTLIEIVVVLTITGAILALGFVGFMNYSKSSNLSGATSNVVSIIGETQSMAKNNVLPISETSESAVNYTYYYLLEFKTNISATSINRYIFKKSKSNVWITTPVSTEQDIQIKLLDKAEYGGIGNECTYVLFESMTGKIFLYKQLSATLIPPIENIYKSTILNCDLTVKLADENLSKKVFVNAENSNFGIKNE